MSQTLTTKSIGRPSVITSEIEGKLTVALQMGLTDEEACSLVEIDRATFYRHLKKDEEFCNKMRAARHYLTIQAKIRVMDIIVDRYNKYSESEAGKMVRWFLERRAPEEYGQICKYCKRRKIRGEWQHEASQLSSVYV